MVKFNFDSGEDRSEQRGGSRQTDSQKELKESMVAHIKSFPVTDSHYSRKKSQQQYLLPHLNISKMFEMWMEKRKAANLPANKKNKSLYENVFRTRFNLAFGTPKSDVCSTCETLKKACEVGSDEKKREAKLLLKLHESRAAKFYSVCKEERGRCDTLNVVFDLQQTQPIPKRNISEAFYRRQVWLYNFGIIIDGDEIRKRKCFLYSWDESQAGRGSNKVCSAVMNFLHRVLHRVRRRRITRLSLISDGCGGQNKNKTMLAALLCYVNSKACPFKEIMYTFPIPGHSFMAPDRLFGRLEKETKKHPQILTPAAYHKLYEKHARVLKYGQHFRICDYKSLADSVMKKASCGIREHRVWHFRRNNLSLE